MHVVNEHFANDAFWLVGEQVLLKQIANAPEPANGVSMKNLPNGADPGADWTQGSEWDGTYRPWGGS